MKLLSAVLVGLLVLQLSTAFPLEETPGTIRPTRPSPKPLEGPFTKQDCFRRTQEGAFYCQALYYRYRWSDQDQDCVEAVYGGCNATKNNFRTIDECRDVTIPICKGPGDQQVGNGI